MVTTSYIDTETRCTATFEPNGSARVIDHGAQQPKVISELTGADAAKLRADIDAWRSAHPNPGSGPAVEVQTNGPPIAPFAALGGADGKQVNPVRRACHAGSV